MTEEELTIIHKDWVYARKQMRECRKMTEEDNSEFAYNEGYSKGLDFVMSYLHPTEWKAFKEGQQKK